MKKLLLAITAIASMLLFATCKEESLGDSKLSYIFKSTNLNASLGVTGDLSGMVVTENANGSINWATVDINISKITFTGENGVNNILLESKNVFNVNPLGPDAITGTVTAPAGNYEHINFKLLLTESAASIPITLKGIYVEGSGTKIPVVVQFNQTQLIELAYPKITFEPNVNYKANITFVLNKLVKGLTISDFGQTTRVAPHNIILVSPTANKALFEKLNARLQSCMNVILTKG